MRLRRRGREAPSSGEVERAEYAFYVSYVRPGMTVLDVGANVGELTLLFSRFAAPGGRVHAFEPGPAYDRLATIVAAANRSNVVLERVAVADRAGPVELRVYGEGFDSWTTLADRPAELGATPASRKNVAAVTLDDYCAEHGIERVDLLKLDVEGAELLALHGAARLLAERRIACCAFEFGGASTDMGVGPRELREALEVHGYRIRNVVAGAPPFPVDADGTGRFSMQLAFPDE